jgi:hypothetical protein
MYVCCVYWLNVFCIYYRYTHTIALYHWHSATGMTHLTNVIYIFFTSMWPCIVTCDHASWHVTVNRDMWPWIVTNFLKIKPTRCTNFSNLFWKGNSTCFGLVPLSIIRSYSLYTQQWFMSYRFVDSFRAGSAVYKPVWHIPLLCVQWITPDDRQSNCPKHVEFHSSSSSYKALQPI